MMLSEAHYKTMQMSENSSGENTMLSLDFLPGVSIVNMEPGCRVLLPLLLLDDLNTSREGNDLVLSAYEGSRIVVSEFFTGETPRFEDLMLADGTPVNPADLAGLLASGGATSAFSGNSAESFISPPENLVSGGLDTAGCGYTEFDLSGFAANAEYFSQQMGFSFQTVTSLMDDLQELTLLEAGASSLDNLLAPADVATARCCDSVPASSIDNNIYAEMESGVIQADGFTEIDLTSVFLSSFII